MAQTQYVELLCSLPHLLNPFIHRRPPISAVQLRKRLNMLDLADVALVQKLAETFYFGRIALESTDAAIVRQAQRLLARVSELPDLTEWLLWRMDCRAVIAALRRRRLSQQVPEQGVTWGYGRYVQHIARHWNQPHFKLESRFPWLPEAYTLLEAGDSYVLEKLLLSTVWNYYTRQRADVPYSLSDVWLYLMKWELVHCWCRYDAEEAHTRFEQMVEEGLRKPTAELRTLV